MHALERSKQTHPLPRASGKVAECCVCHGRHKDVINRRGRRGMEEKRREEREEEEEEASGCFICLK